MLSLQFKIDLFSSLLDELIQEIHNLSELFFFFSASTVGWQKLHLNAENPLVSKTSTVEIPGQTDSEYVSVMEYLRVFSLLKYSSF